MPDHETALAEALHAKRVATTVIEKRGLEAGIAKYNELRGLDDKPGPDPDPKPSEFLVFEDINYRGRPNLQREFGMIPLKIHYERAFLPGTKRRAGDPGFPMPKNELIVGAARSSPEYSCIDIESGWGFSDNPTPPENIEIYRRIAEIYDESLDRGKKFGFYGAPPIRSLNKIGTKEWRDSNDAWSPVVPHLNFTFPSLYVLVPGVDRWVDYAIANIEEAKRVAPDIPCYPFLWFQYHPNVKRHDPSLAGQPIDPDFAMRKLEIVRKHADGVVIWTLSKTKNTPFSDIPPWWNAVVDFHGTL